MATREIQTENVALDSVSFLAGVPTESMVGLLLPQKTTGATFAVGIESCNFKVCLSKASVLWIVRYCFFSFRQRGLVVINRNLLNRSKSLAVSFTTY